MTGLRNRLVTEQDGHQHVSSVLLADEEIPAMLACETILHQAAGWHVDRYGTMLRAHKDERVRWIWVRSRPALQDET